MWKITFFDVKLFLNGGFDYSYQYNQEIGGNMNAFKFGFLHFFSATIFKNSDQLLSSIGHELMIVRVE